MKNKITQLVNTIYRKLITQNYWKIMARQEQWGSTIVPVNKSGITIIRNISTLLARRANTNFCLCLLQ